MGILDRLWRSVFSSSSSSSRSCDDDFSVSGICAVTKLQGNSSGCTLYPGQSLEQEVGVTAKRLGKRVYIHAHAVPGSNVILETAPWQADIPVNVTGTRNPSRSFGVKLKKNVDEDRPTKLRIDIWKTPMKVGQQVAYNNIPGEKYSTKIGSLYLEYNTP